MTATIHPLIPGPRQPRSARVRRPNRRPGAVPATTACCSLGLLPQTPEELSMATAIRAAADLRLPAASLPCPA